MPLKLSQRDQAMLDGHEGPAAQMAMRILARMVVVYGASELLDSPHILKLRRRERRAPLPSTSAGAGRMVNRRFNRFPEPHVARPTRLGIC